MKKARLHIIDAEPPTADVIKRLEEALERAKAGEFSSIALAFIYRDGSTDRSWSTAPSLSLLIGAVERLKAALIRSADE